MSKCSATSTTVSSIFVMHLVNGAQSLNAAGAALFPVILISPFSSV